MTERNETNSQPPDRILSGTCVPTSLIEELVPRGSYLLEFGAGEGAKAQILEGIGYGVMPVDLHVGAVMKTRQKLHVGMQADVTRIEASDTFMALFLEKVPAIYMEGLLCNLPDWPRALRMVDVFLKPGGVVLVSDVSRWSGNHFGLRQRLGEEGYRGRVREWQERYANNEAIGLPDGVFLVAKPGECKSSQWGGPEELIGLMEMGQVEKVARHLDEAEVLGYAENLGWELAHFEQTEASTWGVDKQTGKVLAGAPANSLLPGLVLAWRKPETYRYHPFLYGLSAGSPLPDWVPSKLSVDYEVAYLANLQRHFPDILDYFPNLFLHLKEAGRDRDDN